MVRYYYRRGQTEYHGLGRYIQKSDGQRTNEEQERDDADSSAVADVELRRKDACGLWVKS